MMRDYPTDPKDAGHFINDWQLQDIDKSTYNGITELDNPKSYQGYKFFVRVGGGYQAFKKRVNAKRFYNRD